jgi:hypothetical protein
LGVGQGENVQAVFAADHVQPLGRLVPAAGPEEFRQELPGRAQAHDVADAVQLFVIDHPGGGQVVADLGLGQREDRPVFDPRPDDEGDDPAEGDDRQEAEDEFAAEGKVEKAADKAPARHV